MEESGHNDEAEILGKKAFAELCTALSRSDDPDLIGEFLECLLTPTELREVSTRWALVREIEDGTTQREIARKMGLSLCKITRGSRELKKENSPFKRMIALIRKESE